MPKPILLTTLNARYHHASFGLRYLYANLGDIQAQAQILEFTTNQNARDIVEAILNQNPKVLGFGIYIWNTRQTYDVISLLKRIQPDLLIVLGGPEVSFEAQTQEICKLADFTIQGEADLLFYQFCKNYLEQGILPSQKWVSGPLPEVKALASPYLYYTDEDIRHRVLYVEASRGCPYKCEYCLSSLDKSVRSFDLKNFLAEMDLLIQRGARQFKFVDRTFNLSIPFSSEILNFFLQRIQLGLFLHFEMVPDRLPPELRELIQKFPQGSLQFEIGIQTWSPTVAKLVSRRQDYSKIRENFSYLTGETGVHIHADLIAGLPGETLETFAAGFDAVLGLGPSEIQVGILKRLKGTPIIRHDEEWEMVYQEHSPFQILKTKTMSFEVLQQLNRFSQFWDLYANSGNFKHMVLFMKDLAKSREKSSFFYEFFSFSLFLARRHPQGNGIALMNLVESAWIYLTQELKVSEERARELLILDYTGSVKRDIPNFLRVQSPALSSRSQKSPRLADAAKRQARHLMSFLAWVCLGTLSYSAHATDWLDSARRFTGESDFVKNTTLAQIRKVPHLEELLREALQSEKKFLALDVISHLKLVSLLPTLIEFSKTDDSGYSYHTINSLVIPENRSTVSQLYQTRLTQCSSSMAAKTALIDALTRLQVQLSESVLKALLTDPAYEVRSSALSYLRHWILKQGQIDYLPLLNVALKKNNPFQIKMQALFLISELTPKYQSQFKSLIKDCLQDPNPHLQELCSNLQPRGVK